VSIARYSTVVVAFVTISLGLLTAALGRALEEGGRSALILGGTLTAVNTCAAYALVQWSQSRSNKAFLVAVLGGMTVRMGIMLAVVAVAMRAFELPQLPLVFSLLGYFAVLLAFELTVLSRRGPTLPQPR
jgi:urea transporter